MLFVPRLRLDIAYNGAQFSGWQSQPDGSAVQDHLAKALKTALRLENIWQVASSRTDAGVHAEMQVVAVDVPDAVVDLERLRKSLNALIPETVSVKSIVHTPPSFHPIYDSVAKTYRYRLWTAEYRNPFFEPYVWQIRGIRSLDAMMENLNAVCGTHDFTSMCAADSSAKTRERTIIAAQIERSGDLLDIWIQGDGFLKQMVRNIVGSLVDLDAGKIAGKTGSPGCGTMAEVLRLKDRTRAGRTAPAQGLTLVHVDFDAITPLSEIIARARRGFSVAL